MTRKKNKFELFIVNALMYILFIAFIVWFFEGTHTRWVAIAGILIFLFWQLLNHKEWLKVGFNYGGLIAEHQKIKEKWKKKH